MTKIVSSVVWILVGAILVGCASPQAPPAAIAMPSTSTPDPPAATQAAPTATSGVGEAASTPATAAPAGPTATATAVPPTETPLPESGWTPDGVIDEGEYAHETEAAEVTLHWANDAEYLYGALEAQTEGWVAVAFDPENKMQGANFVFGYVTGGQPSIQDMFGVRPFGPGSHPSDEQLGGRNDVQEFGGLEEGGRTVIEFKIPLDSGDEYDKPLLAGSTYTVLLARGSSDDFQMYHVARDYGEITID